MTPLPYVLSQQAIDDIKGIWEFTVEKWSVEQANRYYVVIFEEINKICALPNRGKSIEHVRQGYMMSKVKSHFIFYRIIQNKIEVIRVLHERMDINRQLNDKD